MRHKLTTYIVNNPPGQPSTAGGGKCVLDVISAVTM